MKYLLLLNVVFLLHLGVPSTGQDLWQSQIPANIVNKFNTDFPKAKDIDWDKSGENYSVEFEIGTMNNDHEIIYSPDAEVLMHKQEISKSDLPTAVKQSMSKEFPRYLIKDVKQIEYPDRTVFTLEAKSFTEDWDIKIDAAGNILSQVRD